MYTRARIWITGKKGDEGLSDHLVKWLGSKSDAQRHIKVEELQGNATRIYTTLNTCNQYKKTLIQQVKSYIQQHSDRSTGFLNVKTHVIKNLNTPVLLPMAKHAKPLKILTITQLAAETESGNA